MSVELLYVGFSCLKLTSEGGVNILIDPWLSSNPACSMTIPELGRIDVLLVSHAAHDHFGDGLQVMQQTNARLIAGKEVVFYCQKKGIAPERMRSVPYGAITRVGDVEVRAVKAEHGSSIELDGTLISGPPLGFMVGFDSGEKLYFSGDTALFGDMKLLGELHKPNIACFGIGSARPGGVIEMTPEEAVIAARFMGAKTVFPIHYLPDSPYRDAFFNGIRESGLGFELLEMQSGERRAVTHRGRIESNDSVLR
ncbi:MAG: metal-dependent hydrolase [Chloroflexi bacterium]|nr:metal-dependent hydrolase [Chloroflexota bacterium]